MAGPSSFDDVFSIFSTGDLMHPQVLILLTMGNPLAGFLCAWNSSIRYPSVMRRLGETPIYSDSPR